jgi:signal transduction histidine kinase/DNA-binding response OmpR family regulator
MFGYGAMILLILTILAVSVVTSLTQNNDLIHVDIMNKMQIQAENILNDFFSARIEAQRVFTTADSEAEYRRALKYIDSAISRMDLMDVYSAQLDHFTDDLNDSIRAMLISAREGIMEVHEYNVHVQNTIAVMVESGNEMAVRSTELFNMAFALARRRALEQGDGLVPYMDAVLLPSQKYSEALDAVRLANRALVFTHDITIVPKIDALLDRAESYSIQESEVITDAGRAAIRATLEAAERYRAMIHQTEEIIKASNTKIAEIHGLFDEIFVSIENGVAMLVVQVEDLLDASIAASRYVVFFMAGIVLVSFVFGVLIAFYLERTIIKDRAKLIEMKDAAEAASRAKSDFLSNMSHEIRTPMSAIIGMTAIAKTSNDVERKAYCLSKIEDASTHLLGVINDILDMSKIEAKKFELSHEIFNFERMLQKVVAVINFRVDQKQQKFIVRLDKDIPPMLAGDDQRLAQVITNLLSNAVKFTPEGGSIRLDTKFIEDKDGFCTIQVSVADSGIGISGEQQSRLFNSFTQAESGTSRKYGGTGLGLAISKQIVEMMNGRIWIESELGKGATFAFTVRMERAPAGEVYGILKRESRSLSILAVDDDPETLAYFGEIAERFGFPYDLASGGEEAIALIEKNGPYSLCFIDWKMPGINGIELSRKIKETGDGKHSIIIMISATEWSVIENDAKSAGVDKFLSKPFFPSSIMDCINDFLGTEYNRTNNEIAEDDTGCFDGYRLLLVEDVQINQEIVMAFLEHTKLEIDCAGNGAEALAVYSAEPGKYDVILMDVQMPEMDGFEATCRIRTFEHERQKPPVPIIAMTANVFREDIEKCLAVGMNDHLGKPIAPHEMMTKLRRYLSERAEQAGKTGNPETRR